MILFIQHTQEPSYTPGAGVCGLAGKLETQTEITCEMTYSLKGLFEALGKPRKRS